MRRKVPSDSIDVSAPPSIPVSAVMCRGVPSVDADMSADSLAAFLLDRQLSGAPVVDGDGRLLGFVSLFDLEREHFERGDTEERLPLTAKSRGYTYRLPAGFHADPIAHATVREIMTPRGPSILDSTPLGAAAALLSLENRDAIPVTDSDGRVQGVLFALDIVRWLAGQSGYADPRSSH